METRSTGKFFVLLWHLYHYWRPSSQHTALCEPKTMPLYTVCWTPPLAASSIPIPPPSLHWLLLTPVCPDNTVMLKQSGSAEKTSTQEGSTQTAASSFRVSKDILYPGCRKTTPRNLSQTGQSKQPSSSPTLWSRHRSGAPTWGI